MSRHGTDVRLMVVLTGLGILMGPGSTSIASAHVGSRVVPIYELPTSLLPELHDGSISDWEEVLQEASLLTLDLAFVSGEPRDLSDLAVRAYLAWNWDSQRLYVAIQRVDNHYADGFPGGNYRSLIDYDSIDFYVDGDHSGGQFSRWTSDQGDDSFLDNRQAQRYSAIPESPDGQRLFYRRSDVGPWVTRPPFGDCGGLQSGDSPNLSLLEFMVTPWDQLDWHSPEASVASRLHGGMIIGLYLTLWDRDRDTDPHDAYTIGGGAPVLTTADGFVDAELIPCQIEGCSGAMGSAVMPSSWARVKAGLR